MPMLRTTRLVQLLLHIDISWPLPPILYCSGHFSALPKLSTNYSFCVPHPFHILHQLSLETPSNNPLPLAVHLFIITCIRSTLPYLEHLITLLLTTFTRNFLLSHILPNSFTNQHNFWRKCEYSCQKENIPQEYSKQLQPFPKHPNIHLANHAIHIYI